MLRPTERSAPLRAIVDERPRIAHNARAIAASRVDVARDSTGVTGAGVLIGQWDDGLPRATHVDLAGRITARDDSWRNSGALEPSPHATHVAGTLISSGQLDGDARGAAPQGTLWSFRWDWDVLEEREAAPFLAVSAHAYGIALGWAARGEGCDRGATFFGGDEAEDSAFGKYGHTAARLDRMLFETDAISVWAAGNERSDSGALGGDPHFHYPDCDTIHRDVHASELQQRFDTLGGAVAAKNALAVGAIADVELEPAPASALVPLAYSSFGPADDGRVKPDLVASGETLYSTASIADDAYESSGGTSSAMAVVAGGVAILTELYRASHGGVDPSAAQMKALLLHTAREAGDHDGPDPQRGFGLFDGAASAELIARDGELRSAGDERVLIHVGWWQPGAEPLRIPTGPVEAGEPLRFTLAWLDPPGAPNEGDIDDRRPALVRDLDLSVESPEQARHHPWRLDPEVPEQPALRDGPNHVDPVERIDVPAELNTSAGSWTIQLAEPAPGGATEALAFALIASTPIARSPRPALASARRVLATVPTDADMVELPIALQNAGRGELEWSLQITEPGDWLTLSHDQGTTPDVVSLHVDVERLPRARLVLGALELRGSDGTARLIGIALETGCTEDCAPCWGPSCGAPGCGAAPLPARLGEALAVGRVQAGNERMLSACADRALGEEAFRFRAPEAGRFELAITAESDAAVLYVLAAALDERCESEELACAAGADARVEVALDRDQALVAVVAAPPGTAFELAIRALREPVCADGAACDDEDPCTRDDICLGGACAGRPLQCGPGEDCASGVCARGGEPVSDAAVAERDGAVPPDAESEDGGGRDKPAREHSAARGCTCRAGAAREPSCGHALALAALLSWRIRRARARRRS
jgi:hypothetical protein